MLPTVRYDAFLSRGAAERRVVIETYVVYEEGKEFRVGREVYMPTSIEEGHDDFDAVVIADLVREVPPDEITRAE